MFPLLPDAEELQPRSGAKTRPPTTEPAKLMPFLIAEGTPVSEAAVRWTLPHGLEVLMVDQIGPAYYLEDADLERSGLTDDDAWDLIMANLERWAIDTGFVSDLLQDGTRLVTHTVGPISSACVLLPNLFGMLSSIFTGSTFRLRVPHRDVMIAYADTEAAEASVRRLVLPVEQQFARSPLVTGVLRLDRNGLSALDEA